MTETTQSIFDLLAWRETEIPRVRTLLAMRKFWSTTLYGSLRNEYQAAIEGKIEPADADGARPIVEELPSMARWAWLNRHIQDRLWENMTYMVETRADDLKACIEPRDGDLGTLSLDPELEYPDYYAGTDFHRQCNGIWRDDRGAAIYAMGARVIHLGKNDDFGLHDAFARDIDLNNPARILDLACGFGKTTFSLKERFPDARVDGIDLAAPCLRLGRRMATEKGLEIDWQQGNIERLPYEAESFDLLTTTMTLHELPLDAISNMMTEARRVLKPNGILLALENPLVGEPLRDVLVQYHSQIIVEPFHFDFRRADMTEFARTAGFADAFAREWYPFGHKPGVAKDPRNWVTPWCWIEAKKGSRKNAYVT